MQNEKNLGKVLIHPVTEINVGVVVMVWNDSFVDRFWKTYKKFKPGIDHKLLLVRNRGGGTAKLEKLLKQIASDYEICEIENFIGKAWLYGYQKLREKCNYIFFTSDSIWINSDNWLLHSFLSLHSTGAGMAAHQFRNGNLRQDFWGAKTEVLDQLNWGKAETFEEWYDLGRSWEWRDLCFSRQCQNLGYSIVQVGVKGIETVIGGDYEYMFGNLKEVPQEVWEAEPPNYQVIKFELSHLLNKGQFDEIIQGLSAFPREKLDADLLNIKAVALYQSDNLIEAGQTWDRALELSPENESVLKNIKSVAPFFRELLLDIAIWFYQKGNFTDVMERFTFMLSQLPDDTEIKLRQIISKNRFQDCDKFTIFLEQNAQYTYMLNNKSLIKRLCGDLCLARGKFVQAKRYYIEALNDVPNDFRAIKGLGDVCLAEKKIAESLEYYQKAADLFKHSPLLYFCMGEALAQLGKIDDAFKYYQKSLLLMPENSDTVQKLTEIIPVADLVKIKLNRVDKSVNQLL
ncbi:MAG: tetratricopeptide repeat protein [Desulfamplus sp.]|nr:tetratricopeptide repeat protein [Desulfamplus sp.]